MWSCCGHALPSDASRRFQQLPKMSLIAALRISFGPIRGFQNPMTTNNSRPWRSFCNGTAVGGQKPGFETFRNFPISEKPGLFVQGSKQPRLEQSRSSIGPDGLGCLTPGRTRCAPLSVSKKEVVRQLPKISKSPFSSLAAARRHPRRTGLRKGG